MKKSIILLSLVSIIHSYSFGQLQIGANVGVNLPTAGIALPGFIQIEKDGTQKVLVATLGAGLNYNLALGYKFSENVIGNVDLGHFSSFKGGFYQYADLDGDDKLETKFDVSFKGTFTHITPNLVFMANDKGRRLRPYARFGLIMGWATVESTLKVQNVPGQNIQKYSGGTSFGFLGGIGVNKKLGNKTSFFAELTTKTVTAYPKQLENLENFGGPKDPTVKFVDQVGPESKPNEALTLTLPYSSLGVSLGLTYQVGR